MFSLAGENPNIVLCDKQLSGLQALGDPYALGGGKKRGPRHLVSSQMCGEGTAAAPPGPGFTVSAYSHTIKPEGSCEIRRKVVVSHLRAVFLRGCAHDHLDPC